MRVTNRMIAQTVLNNLGINMNKLQKQQDQMSSLHVVARTSDDPVIATRVLTLNSVLKQHDQYERNIGDALGWVQTTENTLGNLNDVLQRARELAVYGANGTLDQAGREAIAMEIEQIFDNVAQLANTSYAGRYIFGGTMTATRPFDSAGGYSGNSGADGRMDWEISQGMTMTVNIDGEVAFSNTGIFTTLDNLKTHLQSGDIVSIGGADLAGLDTAINDVLNLRASLGAKANRLETAQKQAGDEKINYEALVSKLNDVDLARLVTDFKLQENVYQAALDVGARILKPTLVDFLR